MLLVTSIVIKELVRPEGARKLTASDGDLHVFCGAQVNGCLSWGDKIAHGFYNIMGIDPHLWAMCHVAEEGRRLPSLAALRAVDATESSLEVVLVDKGADSVLLDLERRALNLVRALGVTLYLVRSLAVLVSDHMG